MSSRDAWVVRSGVGNELIERVEAEGFVALGAGNLGDLRRFKTKADLLAAYQKRNPQELPGQVYLRGGQLWKLAHDVKAKDIVLTPKSATRQILVGFVIGGYAFEPKVLPAYPHIRRVAWQTKVSRDQLKPSLRNSVGSISTLFSLSRFIPDLENLLSKAAGH